MKSKNWEKAACALRLEGKTFREIGTSLGKRVQTVTDFLKTEAAAQEMGSMIKDIDNRTSTMVVTGSYLGTRYLCEMIQREIEDPEAKVTSAGVNAAKLLMEAGSVQRRQGEQDFEEMDKGDIIETLSQLPAEYIEAALQLQISTHASS